jgi:hypothetical protein
MIKLDNDLLAQLGLGGLPPEEKKKMLAHIYETLEMRVGVKLAEQMTDAQLDEFEQFINRNDEPGALQWLETNFPNYKDVVASEFEKLKAEVAQVAPQIVATAGQGMQQPQQPQMGAPMQQQPAPVYGPQPQMPPAPAAQQPQYGHQQPMPSPTAMPAPGMPMAPVANQMPPEHLRQQPQMNPVAPSQPWTPQQVTPGEPWQAQQPPMPPSQQPMPSQPNPTQNPAQDVNDDYGMAA